MRKNNQIFKKALSIALAATMTVTVSQTATFAATDNYANSVNVYADNEDNVTYKYVYAGLTWQEYWANEDVYEAENTQSSDEKDSRGEFDKGGFDAVSRATTNHGIHRGSFQCTTTIYDQDGKTYEILYWLNDDQGKGTSQAVLTDGRVVNLLRGQISYKDDQNNEITATMKEYHVTGIKYVPVAVKSEDYAEFCKTYKTVENGEKLLGGYSEANLHSFDEVANVTEKTNGLKVATKNENGTFSFSKRQVGTESGILDKEPANDGDITVKLLKNEDVGAYGEFMRLDLTGNYGGLGSKMQAVRWTYYGNDDKYTTPIISYGTKFAADNWMHKSNGIQLGLTDSIRCKLPKNTDGTGYWKVTVYALGYKDYEVKFYATKDNVKLSSEEETVDTTELEKCIKEAEKLNEKDYTADSWKVFTEEFEEAKEELAKPQSQATVNEAINHLNAAIKALVKANAVNSDKNNTTSGDKNNTTGNSTNNANSNNNSSKKDDNKQNNALTLKKGETVKVGNFSYVVSKDGAEVELKAVNNRKIKAAIIPATITVNGVTYKVTSIGKNAFKNCSKLKKVTVGTNVTTIGANAFAGDKNLKSIVIKSAKVKKVGAKALKGISKKAKIKVPKSKVKAYKKLLNKKGQSKTVKISK